MNKTNQSYRTISHSTSSSSQAICQQTCMNNEDQEKCLKMGCKGTIPNHATVDSNAEYKPSSTILHAQQYNGGPTNVKIANNYNTSHSLSQCDSGWREDSPKSS